MINECDIALFDCTILNANVLFELGYCISKYKPFYILYNNSFDKKEELVSILKTQWGIWFTGFEELKSKILLLNKDTSEQQITDRSKNSSNESIQIGAGKIDSIFVILDTNYNYEAELEIVKQTFENSSVNISYVDQYNNLDHIFTQIKNSSIVVSILNPILDESSQLYKEVNKINSLKLLAVGIAKGLNRNIFLFQKDAKNYSDVVSFVKNYRNTKEFESSLDLLNKNAYSDESNFQYYSRRIGIPNLGYLIQRERITDFILNNLFAKKIFLRAPSGYGKSSIAVNSLKKLQNIIWYTFDENINNILDVLKEILIELNKFNSEIGSNLNSIFSSFNKNDLSELSLISYFINEIEKIDNKIVLVLDDLHKINYEKYSLLIEAIIKYPFKNLGIILISREDLSIGIEEKNKYLAILQKEEIEFNKSELSIYFSEKFSLDLSDSQLELLHEKSEGWIASISLLESIFAKSGQRAIEEIIDRLQGTDKNIYNYFAEIVYNNFDEETRTNLRVLSIPRIITSDSFSLLTSHSTQDCSDKLNQLEKQNSFLFNFENKPDVYNFHSLFKEFLIKKCEDLEGNIKIISVKSDLSNYYYQHEEYFDALNFGLEGENFSTVVETINKIGNYLVEEGYGKIILEWLNQIPSHFYSDNPAFQLILGRSNQSLDNFEDAWEHYEKSKILYLKTENNKKANVANMFLLNLEVINERRPFGTIEKLNEIIKNSITFDDNETYFNSYELYFQIKRTQLLTTGIDKPVAVQNYEDFLKEINQIILELKKSKMKSEGLILSQLLIEKAMVSHNLGWLRASEFLSEVKIKRHLNILDDKSENFEDIISEHFKKADKDFEEALKIIEENNLILIKANFLVQRATTYSSRNVFYFYNFDFIDQKLFNQTLEDNNKALEIYFTFNNYYSIAVIYNNVASNYLLINDKINSAKFAKLAIDISKQFGFKVLEEKANDILNSPTIKETREESIKNTNYDLFNKIFSEEEVNFFANSFIDSLQLSDPERSKRLQVCKDEYKSDNLRKKISQNWCKHFFIFNTNNPLNIHTDTGKKIIRSYLDIDQTILDLSNLKKEPFKEKAAKFIHCQKFNHYSNCLSDDAEFLSDEFIKNICSKCNQREL